MLGYFNIVQVVDPQDGLEDYGFIIYISNDNIFLEPVPASTLDDLKEVIGSEDQEGMWLREDLSDKEIEQIAQSLVDLGFEHSDCLEFEGETSVI